MVRRRGFELIQGRGDEVRLLAGSAPRSEAREQGTSFQRLHISPQILACQNAGVGWLELVCDGRAASWHFKKFK